MEAYNQNVNNLHTCYFDVAVLPYIGMTTSIADRRGEFSVLLTRHCDVDVETLYLYLSA